MNHLIPIVKVTGRFKFIEESLLSLKSPPSEIESISGDYLLCMFTPVIHKISLEEMYYFYAMQFELYF